MARRGLLAFLAATLLLPTAAGQVMRVHVIDVGQGSATLLEFPCAAVLIDTGGEDSDQCDSTVLLEVYLADFFARRTDLNNQLAALFLTHPHIDHTRGVKSVRDNYAPQNVVTNGEITGSGGAQQQLIHQYAEAHEGTVGFQAVRVIDLPAQGLTNSVIDPVDCSAGGGADPLIRVLWGQVGPTSGWTATDLKNHNNQSLVIRVDYGQASLLITGDLEERGIDDLVSRYSGTSLLDTDIYVVGHHGAANATTDPLLVAISPELAVLSMGPSDREDSWTGWAYGHPRGETISALNQHISRSRSPVDRMVAESWVKDGSGGHGVFAPWHITHAIYATGWDGNVVLDANVNGTITVVSPASGSPPALINLNMASADDIAGLPRIGTTKAQAIVDYRAAHGPFSSVEALDSVPGIGPATIEAIRQLVTL